MAYPNNFFTPINNQQQQAQNQTMLVSVNGEAGAQMYPVASGTTVALIDFSACTFWLKTTDQNGFQQQMRKFKFEEISPAGAENVVTREEFAKLQDKLNQVLDALGEGKKDE